MIIFGSIRITTHADNLSYKRKEPQFNLMR
jgi:hypothetical protein